MFNKIVILYTLFWVALAAAEQVNRKGTWNYCSSRTVQKYKLEYPKSCKPGKAHKSIKNISVVKPRQKVVPIEAWLCRRSMVVYSCTYYFFGAQVCEPSATVYVPVSRDECFLLEETHYSKDGPLFPDADQTSLSSRRKLTPQYTWCATNKVMVTNTYLAKTKLSLDLSSRSFSHPTITNLVCDADKNTCNSPEWRVVFSGTMDEACQTPKGNKTLNIYNLDQNDSLFEVPGETLVFKALSVCDRAIVSCYGQNLLCTPSGYTIILPQEAKVEGEMIEGTLESLPANLRVLEQAVTTLAGEVNLALQSMRTEISMMNCFNARAMLVALVSAQKETPSQVLSLLLGRNAYAIYQEGLLHELECVPTTSVLQPTLEYKGHTAKSPIFHTYVGSDTITTQIRQHLFLTNTIQTTVSDGKRKAFVVRDDVIIYENNTLQEEHPAVATVSIAGFDLKMTKINFEEEDLVTDLIDVTQTEEEYTRQIVNNLALLTETNLQGRGINADFLYQIHQGHSNEFMRILQESQMPTVYEIIKNVFMWTANTWSVVLSLTCLFMLFRCCKNRRNKEDNKKTVDIEMT